MRRASSRHTTTKARLLEMPLRTLDGMYLTGHREGGGEVQNVSEDESELADEDADEWPEDKEKIEADFVDGVASNLGDLSTKGSLTRGVLESLHTMRSRRLMFDCENFANPYRAKSKKEIQGWSRT